MEQPDDEQVRAAVAGDGKALTALLRRHGPVVRGRLRINPVWQAKIDPDDIMQVTYLEAFLRIRQLRTPTTETFVAWLTRIAQNNLQDTIRELERQRRPSPQRQITPNPNGESGTSLLSTLTCETGTPSSSAARHESQEALRAALDRLPRSYAQVLQMYDLEERSVDEVAATLGRSPAAVHLLRARAMDRLCELLGSESRFFGSRA